MLVRNLNFSAGLVNGQKCVLHAIFPNSRVIQAELLTEETPHLIVIIPRINSTATVGKRGISFSRVQFPLRTAYAMTINKIQGQTLARIGLDLRFSPFAHSHLYLALSRAQNKNSIMCFIPPSQGLQGVPHTDNIVYSPFVEAATGISNNTDYSPSPPHPLLPPTSPSPNQPHWLLQPGIGDGACGFRALARHFLGDPELHFQIRQQVVQYMSENRDNSDLRIYEGIGIEILYRSGMQPCRYFSYDDYLAMMPLPHTYMGQPQLTAATAIYAKQVRVHFDNSTLPSPLFATTDDIHLRFSAASRNYDTFKLIISTPCEKTSPPVSGH